MFAHLIRREARPRIQSVVAQFKMTSDETSRCEPPYVSIAIFAWNEERAIESTLRSLLEQDLYAELRRRELSCEVICVANGCTDRTAEVAGHFLSQRRGHHPDRGALHCSVVNLAARGKVNAWNQFVHRLSAPTSSFLFMMDADILIHRHETLRSMLNTLENDPGATVAVDVPRKDIAFKKRQSLSERLSLAASRMTSRAEGQLCGQLYCIRAEAARRIYMPKDLAACEDGFIKALVCTDFLEHAPWPGKLRVAPDAEHTFEAYTSPLSILKNQKRQIIGQTIVHLLVDHYLPALRASELQDLPAFLGAKDATDPGWLKRLITEHLRRSRAFWRLHPGLLGNRLQHLRRLRPVQKICCLPAALASSGTALVASFLAYRSLKKGCTDYWPKARRVGLEQTRRVRPEHTEIPTSLAKPSP